MGSHLHVYRHFRYPRGICRIILNKLLSDDTHVYEGDTFQDTFRRDEQLAAASKQLKAWDFDRVLRWARRKGIERHLVPTGGQHIKGQVEQWSGYTQNKCKGVLRAREAPMKRCAHSCRRLPK